MVDESSDYFSKEDFFYSDISKQIARIELDKTIKTYFNKIENKLQ